MLYDGKGIQCVLDNAGIIKVTFDIKDAGANVLGRLMIEELPKVVEVIENCKEKRGVIFRSAKSHFIYGADITEFVPHFKKPKDEIRSWISPMNNYLNRIEDLDVPTITLINGYALGGGFEVCLMTDYRLAVPSAKVGLPETKLGIMPGWGGSVRLPRLCGADHAIEWITSGKQWKAEAALKIGAIDGIVSDKSLDEMGDQLMKSCLEGKMDWRARKLIKKAPLQLNRTEATMVFETAKGFVASVAGPNYPAPVRSIEVMQKACSLERNAAIDVEAEAFAELATTDVAHSLIQVFLADQYLKKVSKGITKSTKDVSQTAVLGAGIMGGGVAYQSASMGTPIIMKDINPGAIELGLGEATKLLGKQLERKKIKPEQMAKTLNMITPTLSYGDFNTVDLVVEAVVENVNVKKSVLAELEKNVSPGTILTSNTSTISITELASALEHPENFCGMHFFNPVHRMPLVEVIRGEKSSDEAIARTVKYAIQMGKTPIVVNDCAGFLVNRVLFPYFNAFGKLIEDGVDYIRIDKVMEKFGWPMGPAYLMDVVGIDTGAHAAKIMADAFPDRMKMDGKTIIDIMYEQKRFGQKNGVGFYKYEIDKKGKPKKVIDEKTNEIIATVAKGQAQITDEEIVERMMLPMIFECARCLEENIVATPTEVDMGLLLGLGFPPFRAGALKYADRIGAKNILALSEKYTNKGNMYLPTEGLRKQAAENKTYY